MSVKDSRNAEFDELKLQLALAVDHIETLDRTVYRQQQQLDLLQDQLRELHRRLLGAGIGDSTGAALAADPREDIPPHY